MLDFYNELGEAIRGRLEGADTIARVNEALRDTFQAFILDHSPYEDGEAFVIPILAGNKQEVEDFLAAVGGAVVDEVTPITPPLRKLHAPSAQLANTQV